MSLWENYLYERWRSEWRVQLGNMFLLIVVTELCKNFSVRDAGFKRMHHGVVCEGA